MNGQNKKHSKEQSDAPAQNALYISSLNKLLSRLNSHAFAKFTYQLCAFDKNRFESQEWLPDVGEGVFRAAFLDSYGGSLHNVWVLHFLPPELFSKTETFHCKDPGLISRLQGIGKLYRGKTGAWGMVDPYLKRAKQLQNICILTNIHGFDRISYAKKFIPAYGRVIRKSGLHTSFQLGSYDSFVDLNESQTQETFQSFLAEQADGLSINLNPDKSIVAPFAFECPTTVGQERNKIIPVDPIYVRDSKSNAVAEFESLLKPNVSEAKIERFLKAHFQEVFGFEYDRIETQLWLRFPKLDVAGKDRRLDMFLRSSVHNDWDLFELKRIVRVTGHHRDIPVLAAEVSRSIQQTLYYSKLLSRDSVKQQLAKQGIDYFEPSINLVIGRKPQIAHDYWRWLVKNAGGVHVLTYDNLLDSMRRRVEDRKQIAK